MRWQVEYDSDFGGWIVTTRYGELVARFETAADAYRAADAVNAQAVQQGRRTVREVRA